MAAPAQAPVVYGALSGNGPSSARTGPGLRAPVAHNGQIMKADLASQGLKGAKVQRAFSVSGCRWHAIQTSTPRIPMAAAGLLPMARAFPCMKTDRRRSP